MTAIILPSLKENIAMSFEDLNHIQKNSILMALRLEAINKGKEIHCRGNEIPP